MLYRTFTALIGADGTVPGIGSATVTPSDTANFTDADGRPLVARGLEILAAGTLSFVGVDGAADTRTVVDAWVPYLLPVACVRVNSTGTSVASGNIKAIW